MIKNNKCRVCLGKHTRTINILLNDGRSPSEVAEEFKLKTSTVEKHLELCGVESEKMAKLEEHKPIEPALGPKDTVLSLSTLSDNVKSLYIGTLEVIEEAEEAGSHQLKVVAIREARSILEMFMKASSMLLDRSSDRDWQVVLSLILKALKPFPEAKKAVAKTLDEHKQ